jgi:HK97 family phage prohead protease
MNNNRNSGIIQFKGMPFELKDMDEEKGIVSGYLSAFNTMDADRDIILPGAFEKSVAERGPKSAKPRIKYLRYHSPEMPIGKFTELYSDSYGLHFVGELSKSTDGRNAFEDYKAGIITEHSIGFNYVSDKIEYDKEADAYLIKEVRLWEGSAVTWGANEYTFTESVKSMSKDKISQKVDQMMKLMTAYTKALRTSKATDEHLEEMELKFLILQANLKEYFDYFATLSKEPGKTTSKGTEPAPAKTFLDYI